jgi:apolipoprotein N-acyltransferase
VNLADDGWLSSREASRQITQLARFRAIEQRLALVRVAHGGVSAVVDEFGRVRERLPVGRYAARRVAVYAAKPATWRERAAILAPPAAAFCAVIGMPARARRAGSTRRARAAPSPRRA